MPCVNYTFWSDDTLHATFLNKIQPINHLIVLYLALENFYCHIFTYSNSDWRQTFFSWFCPTVYRDMRALKVYPSVEFCFQIYTLWKLSKKHLLKFSYDLCDRWVKDWDELYFQANKNLIISESEIFYYFLK